MTGNDDVRPIGRGPPLFDGTCLLRLSLGIEQLKGESHVPGQHAGTIERCGGSECVDLLPQIRLCNTHRRCGCEAKSDEQNAEDESIRGLINGAHECAATVSLLVVVRKTALMFLDSLVALCSRQRQRIGDRADGTLVLRRALTGVAGSSRPTRSPQRSPELQLARHASRASCRSKSAYLWVSRERAA